MIEAWKVTKLDKFAVKIFLLIRQMPKIKCVLYMCTKALHIAFVVCNKYFKKCKCPTTVKTEMHSTVADKAWHWLKHISHSVGDTIYM